jgi:hypothetical protein
VVLSDAGEASTTLDTTYDATMSTTMSASFPGQSPAPRRGEAAAIVEGHTPDEDEESAYLADDQVGCGGCFFCCVVYIQRGRGAKLRRELIYRQVPLLSTNVTCCLVDDQFEDDDDEVLWQMNDDVAEDDILDDMAVRAAPSCL